MWYLICPATTYLMKRTCYATKFSGDLLFKMLTSRSSWLLHSMEKMSIRQNHWRNMNIDWIMNGWNCVLRAPLIHKDDFVTRKYCSNAVRVRNYSSRYSCIWWNILERTDPESQTGKWYADLYSFSSFSPVSDINADGSPGITGTVGGGAPTSPVGKKKGFSG